MGEHYNPKLKIGGVTVRLMPPRGWEPQLRLDELVTALGDMVSEPPVSRRSVVSEAMGACAPVPSSAGRRDVIDILDTHPPGCSPSSHVAVSPPRKGA